MSLIGWWKLDSDAADSTLNNYDGTATNVTWMDGKIGGAGNFDGSTSFISAPQVSDYLHGRPEASIAFWCKKDAIQYGFIQLSGFASTNGNLYPYTTETRVYLDVFRTNRLGPIEMHTSVLEWHHVVITQGPGVWKLYQNGELVHEASANDTVATDYLQFEIGRNSGARYANGRFDDVKVYDHALSLKEIKELAKAKVAHWKFDDFQESTDNIAQNPDYADRPYDTVQPSSGWGGDTGEVTYFASGGFENLPYKKLTKLTAGTGGAYMDDNAPIPIENNATYTISGYMKASRDVTLNAYALCINRAADNAYRTSGDNYPLTTKWQRFSWTYNSGVDHAGDYKSRHIVYVDEDLPLDVYWCGFQIEKKDHLTPFVIGVRTGITRDSTGYGADLDVPLTSPRWDSDTAIGKYSIYPYDGSPLEIQDDQLGEDISALTIAMWVKTSYNSDWTYYIHRATTTNIGGSVYWVGTSTSGHYGASVNGNYTGGTTGVAVDGDWHHIALTWDGSTQRVYVDGNLEATAAVSGIANTAGTRAGIGGTPHNETFRRAQGLLDDIRIYATALSDEDVSKLYQQRGSLDNQGNLFSHYFNETKHAPLIMDYTVWTDGTTGSEGAFLNLGSSTDNHRMIDTDPWLKETVIWEARPDGTGNASGGWNGNLFDIDNTKTYRFSVWVNRRVMGSDGRFYLGTGGWGSVDGVSYNDSGTITTNPYFWTSANPPGVQLPEGEWVLVVGHVHPHDYTGGQHPDSGRYTVNNGYIGGISRDFNWLPETTRSRHRTYLYYCTDTNVRQQWVYPRVDICDGTEPSISELLNGLDSRNIDYIREIGGTTSRAFSVGSKSTKISKINEIGPSNGLTNWWTLDGNVDDTSGQSDGTNSGATVTQGYGQQAYDFDGTSSYIGIDGSVIEPHSGSLSAWIYLDAWTNDYGSVFHSGTGAGWAGLRFVIFRYSANNNLVFSLSDGTNYLGGTGPKLYPTVGTWHHIVATYNGKTAETFMDGVPVQSVATSITPGVFTPVSTTMGWNNYSTRYWDGKIQDLRIYNRALSAEEIGILYDLTVLDSGTMMKQTLGTIYLRGQFNEVSL